VAEARDADRLTWWQRLAPRRMHRAARKTADEPLTPEDWAAYFEMASDRMGSATSNFLRALPASPRCGMTTEAGVLFADLRGFTRLSEQSDPAAVSALLRRFYACAEDVLFPEAVIDKLIGDEVMRSTCRCSAASRRPRR
jgi:adenylate cyclase